MRIKYIFRLNKSSIDGIAVILISGAINAQIEKNGNNRNYKKKSEMNIFLPHKLIPYIPDGVFSVSILRNNTIIT